MIVSPVTYFGDPNFLSVFGTEINSNNGLESYNKKINARIGTKKPNLQHRKHAQREILANRFTPIQFINYLVENWGTKFFSQINISEKRSNDEKKSPEKIPQEAPNHELCIECSTPRI